MAADERSFRVQRGELPAETVYELVDALRQELAGAGAALGSVRIRGQRLAATDAQERAAFEAAIERVMFHLTRLDDKASLAFNGPGGRGGGVRRSDIDAFADTLEAEAQVRVELGAMERVILNATARRLRERFGARR